VPNQDPLLAQVVAEGVGDLVVQAGEQAIARVDQVRLHAQAAEDGGVLAADNAGRADGDGARGVGEPEDGIAVQDARMREIEIGRMIGARAGCDHDGVSREQLPRPALASFIPAPSPAGLVPITRVSKCRASFT
jgi:hypothetical protein